MVSPHQQVIYLPPRGPAKHGGAGTHHERHRQGRLPRPGGAGENRVITSPYLFTSSFCSLHKYGTIASWVTSFINLLKLIFFVNDN